MNIRVTLLSLLVAAGLGIYLWYSESQQDEDTAAETQAAKLIPVQAADVTSVTIQHSGRTYRLQRGRQNWFLHQPLEARCDPEEIQAFLELLGRARVEEKIGAGDIVRYGLDAPSSRIDIVAQGEHAGNYTLRFGRINPLQTLVYVLVGESNEVILTTSELLTRSLNTTFGWRDKSVIQTDRSRVTRMRFRTISAGSLEVWRDDKFHWRTASDPAYRVDPRRLQSVLVALTNLRAVGIKAENKVGVAAHGVNNRRMSVILEYNDGSIAGDLVLGFAQKDGSYAAIVPNKPEIFAVNGNVASMIVDLATNPRDTKMFASFVTSDIKRIEVTAPSDTFTLERMSIARWRITSTTKHPEATTGSDAENLDMGKIEIMLDNLQTMKISKFPEQQPGPGFFVSPKFRVALYDKDGLVSGIEVGKRNPNDRLSNFARGIGEPSVFLVSPSVLVNLPYEVDLYRALPEPFDSDQDRG